MAKYGLLVIVAFLIGGCASQSTPTQSAESVRILQCTEGWGCVSGPEDTPLPASTDNARVQTNPSSQPRTSSAAQQILISDIQGNVSVQEASDGSYVPAQSGKTIPLGASIQTYPSSRARLTIQPDGTSINVGTSSTLVIKDYSPNRDGQPEMHITLATGRIWILPRDGQIAIKTDIGIASSGGGPLGVNYDPKIVNLEASCLDGICSLKNAEGEIILTSGMMATINKGHLPYSSQQMNGDVLQEWANENPNLRDYFGGQLPGWLPLPESLPGN